MKQLHSPQDIETRVVGILNLSEDSFSDGGLYSSPEAAVSHAVHLRHSGASYVELGPTSTHPDSRQPSSREEIERIGSLLDELKRLEIPCAVDSFQPETQLYAAESGALMINDVRGFADEAALRKLAKFESKLVAMFSAQTSATKVQLETEETIARMYAFFEQKISQMQSAGINDQRIILDPGMGFFLGGDAETSFAMLRELPKIKKRFSLPLFLSVSRKSFLRSSTGLSIEDSSPATLSAELSAVALGASYIRTHDVAALLAALRIRQRIFRE